MSEPDVTCRHCHQRGFWIGDGWVHYNGDYSHNVEPVDPQPAHPTHGPDSPADAGNAEKAGKGADAEVSCGLWVFVALAIAFAVAATIITDTPEQPPVDDGPGSHLRNPFLDETNSSEARLRRYRVPDGRTCWAVKNRSRYVGNSHTEQLRAGQLFQQHCAEKVYRD